MDRIAKLGGTLGLCANITGGTILTMIHLLVLIIKVCFNCCFKHQNWNRIRGYCYTKVERKKNFFIFDLNFCKKLFWTRPIYNTIRRILLLILINLIWQNDKDFLIGILQEFCCHLLSMKKFKQIWSGLQVLVKVRIYWKGQKTQKGVFFVCPSQNIWTLAS